MPFPFDNCLWQSLIIITSHATGIELYLENESARWSVMESSGLECTSTGSCTKLHIHSSNHHIHCHKAFYHSWLYLGLCLQASHGVSHVLNFYCWKVWGNLWLYDIYSCVTTKSQILHPVREIQLNNREGCCIDIEDTHSVYPLRNPHYPVSSDFGDHWFLQKNLQHLS